jgi:hypothetical protein
MVMPETSPRMALEQQTDTKGGDAKGSQSAYNDDKRGLPVGRASLIALRGAIKGLVTSVTSGQSSGVSLAYLSPDGSWLKMYQEYFQATLDGSLEKFSLTWPRWGTLLDGVLSELSTWEHGTGETGCSLWPTPVETDKTGHAGLYPKTETHHEGTTLATAVKMFPTPNAHDGRRPGPEPTSTQGANLKRDIEGDGSKGSLNPDWVEWLMGAPIGWTSLPESPELPPESRTASSDSEDLATP